MKASEVVSALLSSLVLPFKSPSQPLTLGSPIPPLTIANHLGSPIHLADAYAHGYLLIYFFPKADTPGCTRQSCSLRDAFESLSALNVSILGSSLNSPAEQNSFRQRYLLPFTLLADEKGLLADAFGVPHALGFSRRQSFLFLNGSLVWRDLAASTDQQATDILAFLQGH